jgi:predicted nucleotidyltransferase
LAISLFYAASASAQRFKGVTGYTVNSGPQGIACADMNGDGWADIVVASSGANALSLLLNQAAQPGLFAATPLTFPVRGTYPVALAVGDVNADSLADVVVVNETSSSVSVLLHTTSPSLLASAVSYSAGALLPRGIALGDVNGDQLLDIVVAATASGKVGVLLNTPTAPGTFQTARTFRSGGTRPEGLALGDVNGDGQLDIVVVNQASNTVAVLLNSSKTPGKFATPTTYSSGGASPRGVTVSDLNRDGLVDVLVANTAAGTVGVLAANATAPGTLLPATVYASPATGPLGISAGDVTGDQVTDIVVADYAAKEGTALYLLVQSPSAPSTFQATSGIYGSGGVGPHDVLMRDLNGDGYLDIVTSNFGTNTVGVLLNSSKP